MMIEILEKWIKTELGYESKRMDGKTGVGNRIQMVDSFNHASYEDQFIFLMTTHVGGVGLNITG